MPNIPCPEFAEVILRRGLGHLWLPHTLARSAVSGGLCLLAGLLFLRLLRSQDRVQRVALLPRPELHNGRGFHIFKQPLQHLASQARAGHLTSPEKDGGLYLLTVIPETQHVSVLGLVVLVACMDPELHCPDCDGLIALLCTVFS